MTATALEPEITPFHAIKWAARQNTGAGRNRRLREKVFMGIALHADQFGYAFPTQAQIGEYADDSDRRTVTAHCKVLEDSGFIARRKVETPTGLSYDKATGKKQSTPQKQGLYESYEYLVLFPEAAWPEDWKAELARRKNGEPRERPSAEPLEQPKVTPAYAASVIGDRRDSEDLTQPDVKALVPEAPANEPKSKIEIMREQAERRKAAQVEPTTEAPSEVLPVAPSSAAERSPTSDGERVHSRRTRTPQRRPNQRRSPDARAR